MIQIYLSQRFTTYRDRFKTFDRSKLIFQKMRDLIDRKFFWSNDLREDYITYLRYNKKEGNYFPGKSPNNTDKNQGK